MGLCSLNEECFFYEQLSFDKARVLGKLRAKLKTWLYIYLFFFDMLMEFACTEIYMVLRE